MTKTITGSCNCGRHTFTIPKPTEMNCCHCIDCRKWSGSMYSPHMFVKTSDVDPAALAGARTHRVKGEEGNEMERAWCDECGSGLWIKNLSKPELTNLKAGLFKPHEIPSPTSENWLKNIEEWETPLKGTKRQSQTN